MAHGFRELESIMAVTSWLPGRHVGRGRKLEHHVSTIHGKLEVG